MNPIVDKVLDGNPPYKCPRCGTELNCFFHERDSTSDYMNCPKCSWSAHTGIDGEWGCSGEAPDLYFPLNVHHCPSIGLRPHLILAAMEDQWDEKDRMNFVRALVDTITSQEAFSELFEDRCRHCGRNLLSIAGSDRRCFCQDPIDYAEA